MAYYKRTRVVSQDMRTGEFAYLDQLIHDGYNPGLLVLPKNWEPPLRQGPSSLLPIEPIINLSPPNTTDTYPVIIQNLVNIDTGAAVFELFSIGACGTVTSYSIVQNITGIESVGSIGTVPDNVGQPVVGVENVGNVGTAIDNIRQSISITASSIGSVGTTVYEIGSVVDGVESVGSIGNTIYSVSQIIDGISSIGSVGTTISAIGMPVTGVESVGSVGIATYSINDDVIGIESIVSQGTVLNGSGWGQGGGWGSNGWGVA